MKKPVRIAIVGRPNVGKSSLFNRILGKRFSIVSEEEGVTRDRIYGEMEFFGTPLTIIDTGGIDNKQEIPFAELVKGQAITAMNEANCIIMVVDGVVGPTLEDKEIADFLHQLGRPVVLAINKSDKVKHSAFYDFYELGITEMMGISAIHGHAVADLFEKAVAMADFSQEINLDDNPNSIKIALIGKPNVGKSTFFNALLSQERSIVSDIAGTTRDSIDVDVTINGQNYTFIDTAGIKRKNKEKDVIEKFAHIRTERAINRADICLLLIDSQEGMTQQEKKIANLIEEAGKGCIVFCNKWDLVHGYQMEHCKQAFYFDNEFLKHCPIIFGSAKTKRNLDQVFPVIHEVYHHLNQRISTGELNRFIERCIQINHPPMIQGKRLRIYYATQANTNPPRIVLFVNDKKRLDGSYLKYLENKLRESYKFLGTPFRLEIRPKPKKTVTA